MGARDDAAIKERVKAQFAATAARYVVSKGHASGDDLERLTALAAATTDDRALDIATGGGHTGLAIARTAGSVVVSDFTLAMLQTARGFISSKGMDHVTYALADAEALPFADHAFDIVTTRIAPHHFPNPRAYVHEVARVLEPGGRFLLEDSVVPEGEAGDFLNDLEKIRDGSHVHTATESEWLNLLRDAEFEIESAELFRKEHELEQWIGRANASGDRVRQAWANAADETKQFYDVKYNPDGSVYSYSDDKIVILATKPLSTY
jgi:ubiquinone/menaquinone biosynthesis C-methylase UbiE